MDQETLVTEDREAAEVLIDRFGKKWPVQTAFWLKSVENGRWILYIAAQGIEHSNVDQGYREVLRQLKEMRPVYLDPFQVELITVDDPLVPAVETILQRHPENRAFYYKGSRLGGMSIGGAYLYPPLTAVPANQG